MTSGALEQQRPGRQRRLLVFGDSVVWGGSVLDQRLIATELLAQQGITEVGNVAVASWGRATGSAMPNGSAFWMPPTWCW